MDVDQFVAANEAAWRRLAVLTGQARRIRDLTPAELDELVALYQRTSSQLSHARHAYADPGLTGRLTRLVADANGVVYGRRPRTLRSIGRFFTESFPAAVWHDRWFVVVSAAIFFVPALIFGAWLGTSDRAVEVTAPEEVREAYIEEDFEDYYSSEPAGQFATEVTVNNIQVAILAFALGVFFCVGTVYVLASNGVFLGVAAGLFVHAGQADRFFGLILPHGLLELSAIVVAGAAGLRLGWAIIDPGDRSRAAALAEEGRRAVVIVLGLFVVFITAGLIEGFVTGSGLSTWFRVGVGVLAEAGFVLWIVGYGRPAASRGRTGLLGEGEHRTWEDDEPPPPPAPPPLRPADLEGAGDTARPAAVGIAAPP